MRKLESLTDEESELLFNTVVEEINKAYQLRGASLRSYHDLFGNPGQYEVIIYNEKHDPDGNVIETCTDRDKRRVWFVPEIQRLITE
jgi:hypothetical protein